MFCFNLFQKKQTKGKYAYEAYKKVPTKDLAFYAHRKRKLRYQKGYNLDPSTSQKLQEFVHTTPQISLLLQQKEIPLLEKKMTEEFFLRKIRKSQFEELQEKFKLSKFQKFNDPDFPPNQKSIGKVFNAMKIEWKRIPDVIKDAKFICDTVSPEDVFQGEIGNCYFLSAVSALAENDFRIKNIFGDLSINPNGFYMARIMFRGVYQQVVVDDYIPVGNNNYPLFSKPTKKNEVWVMILQKCWAKLFGSYENTISGYPNEVLHAFSAAPTFQHQITDDKLLINQLFQTLFHQDNKGSVMCCGTISDQNIFKYGLVNDHAYALLQVYQQPYRMIKLRNPWGNIQWKGRASKNDTKFWNNMAPYDKERIGYQNGQGGTFFMLWQDFIRFFKIIDVCKIQDNANYIFVQNSFVKEKGRLFQLQTKGGQVTIALSQTNLRGNKNKKLYGRAILILGKISQDNKVQIIKYKYVTSNSGKTYADFYLHVEGLQKGMYKIYAQVEWETQQQDIGVVSVYTDQKVSLKEDTSKRPNEMEFLYQIFIDHASSNLKSIQYFSKDPLEYIAYDLLIDSCGYGYVIVHLSPKSRRKLGLQFNQKYFIYDIRQFLEKKLKLLSPYKGKGKFKLTVEPGKTVVVLYKIADKVNNYPAELTLPFPKIFALTK